ncbi:ATP-NAD kinase-like domain-containing protein [Phlyctochytrium arcticum]|nr:ATP-NAD kinase-like domain-containing protein [Phlyctochytrium arcticum]
MIVAKAFDAKIIKFTRQLACHLIDTPRSTCNVDGLAVYIDAKFRTSPVFAFDRLLERYPHYAGRLKFWTPELCATQTDKIDFVITLGGDGTVIYTSWLFQHAQVPPVVAFDLGSLGFLTNFNVADIRNVLRRIIGCAGDGVRVNMRMRLSCTVWRTQYKGRKGGLVEGRVAGKTTSSLEQSYAFPGELGMLEEAQAALGLSNNGCPRSDEDEDIGLADNDQLWLRRTMSHGRNIGDADGPNSQHTFPVAAVDDLDYTNAAAPRLSSQGNAERSNIGNLLDELASQLSAKALPEIHDDLSSPRRSSSLRHLPTSAYADATPAASPLPTSTGSVNAASLNPAPKPVPTETFQIVNDLVVDRGPSAYMSQLELFVDDRHLTTIQADGLVLATPTGSTAYSLSAGGSLVHPEVPSVLVTPICPHTLSFRPMLLPDSVEIRIQVPKGSRTSAWASFDGRHRIELKKGDFVTVNMSRWPMPTVCEDNQGSDWFESLRRCLHWNLRARQKPFNDSAPTSYETIGQNLNPTAPTTTTTPQPSRPTSTLRIPTSTFPTFPPKSPGPFSALSDTIANIPVEKRSPISHCVTPVTATPQEGSLGSNAGPN